MFFVLPGKDGAPVETLRYEALRAAAQDYELLKLVEQRALSTNQARQVIDEAMACVLQPNAIRGLANPARMRAEELYSLDPKDYQAARRLLIEALT
jgi:hypothetical protein